MRLSKQILSQAFRDICEDAALTIPDAVMPQYSVTAVHTGGTQFFYYFFYFTILYWFCHTLTWICHGYTRVPHPGLLSQLPPHAIPLHHPNAPAPTSCIIHRTWTDNSFHLQYYTCFNAILPNHHTLALSHRVQRTVLYICVAFAFSHTGLSLPSF